MREKMTLARKAMLAMQTAVIKAIEAQQRQGLAIPVWRDGKIVWLRQDMDAVVRERGPRYGGRVGGGTKMP